MTKIDDTISQLSHNAGLVQRHYSLRGLLVTWVGGILIYIGLIFCANILELRPDFFDAVMQPFYAAELITLLFLIMSTVFALATLAFPDLHQTPKTLYAPIIAFLSFVLVLLIEFFNATATDGYAHEGYKCLACISALSLLPAGLMFFLVHRMATTQPKHAGMLAALCAFSLGAFMLRLSEPTNIISHVILWHYFPMLFVAIIGTMLGPKLLKW